MRAHAAPHTPARATTVSSSAPSTRCATPRSGTDTARSSRPVLPRVHTSATLSVIVFFSDSASCNSSSSSGSARVSRLPKVRITSSGAWRSPYTRRVAKSVSRWRIGIQRSAATAAANIERPRRVFSSPVGERPRPSTMSRYDAATIAARPAMVIVWTRRRSMRTATPSDAPSARESGTRMLVLSATARIGSGQVTSSCNTHAVNEIAAATTTPHAGHCSRARSCTDFAARQRATYPISPTTASMAATVSTGQSATRGRSFTRNPATTALAA